MQTKMTIREIRKFLFDNDVYTVMIWEEMNNKQSRDFLYQQTNQDLLMNVIINKTHLLIYY
jgi:Trm5-related predicted tRNA methylase